MADSKNFSDQIKQTVDTIDALSVRERVIIFACLVSVVVGSWDVFLFSAVSESSSQIEAQIDELRDRIEEQEGSRDILVAQLSVDPDRDIKQQQADLEEELRGMSKGVKKLSRAFVPVDQLPLVLESVLEKNELVQLISLEMKEVKALQNTMVKKNSQGKDVEQVNGVIYQHGFKIVIEGRYFDTVRYLQQFESLEWQIYWRSIDYSVESYPLARVVLEVFTLSEQG